VGIASRVGRSSQQCTFSIYNRVDPHRALVITVAAEAAARGGYTWPAWAEAVAERRSPIADAYVRGGSPNKNFGTAKTLLARNASSLSNVHDSYLKFDLSGVGTVSSARLRVMAKRGSGTASAALSAYAASGSWAETSLTWSNRPPKGAAVSAPVVIASTSEALYTLDVTGYVQDQLANGVVTVVLGEVSPGPLVTIRSREAASMRPELVIVH
jgi:hypothetical protein